MSENAPRTENLLPSEEDKAKQILDFTTKLPRIFEDNPKLAQNTELMDELRRVIDKIDSVSETTSDTSDNTPKLESEAADEVLMEKMDNDPMLQELDAVSRDLHDMAYNGKDTTHFAEANLRFKELLEAYRQSGDYDKALERAFIDRTDMEALNEAGRNALAKKTAESQVTEPEPSTNEVAKSEPANIEAKDDSNSNEQETGDKGVAARIAADPRLSYLNNLADMLVDLHSERDNNPAEAAKIGAEIHTVASEFHNKSEAYRQRDLKDFDAEAYAFIQDKYIDSPFASVEDDPKTKDSEKSTLSVEEKIAADPDLVSLDYLIHTTIVKRADIKADPQNAELQTELDTLTKEYNKQMDIYRNVDNQNFDAEVYTYLRNKFADKQVASDATKKSIAGYGSGVTGLWDAQEQAKNAKTAAHPDDLVLGKNEAAKLASVGTTGGVNTRLIGTFGEDLRLVKNADTSVQPAANTEPRPQDLTASERERNAFLDQNAKRYESNWFEKRFTDDPIGTAKGAYNYLSSKFKSAFMERNKARKANSNKQEKEGKKRFLTGKMVGLVGGIALISATVTGAVVKAESKNSGTPEPVDNSSDKVSSAPAVPGAEASKQTQQQQEKPTPQFNRESRVVDEGEGWGQELRQMGVTEEEIPSKLEKLLKTEDSKIREWVYTYTNPDGTVEPRITKPGEIPVSVLESIKNL